MAKRPFKRVQKKKRHGVNFWDREYTNPENLQLSTEPSGDLLKFTRYLLRETGQEYLKSGCAVLDVGCGNGRNLTYLAREFGVSGTGFDNSPAAIAQAKALAAGLPLTYTVRSMSEPLPLPDASQAIVLDMMSSHFLDSAGRSALRDEIFRVLMPGGWLFFKTFLKDGDLHTQRLLAEHPAAEPDTYIHPVIGIPEYVYSEEVLREFLEPQFELHKVYRSHKHVSRGKARKRRTISVYARKPLL